MDLHKLATERSLAFHRVVAERMVRNPVILDKARERVNTWLSRNPASPFAREWEKLLRSGAETVAGFLIERTEFAEEMRQSSPFAGTLDARERWDIWRDTRQRLTSGG